MIGVDTQGEVYVIILKQLLKKVYQSSEFRTILLIFSNREDHPYPHLAMATSQFPEYIAEVLQLKQEYSGKIEVLLGIEADFFPEDVKKYRRQFDRYPFDYIIGSVHHVDGVSIFNKTRWDGLSSEEKVRTKELYYSLIEQSARSGLFQILGHIDAMKGYYPEFSAIQTAAVETDLKGHSGIRYVSSKLTPLEKRNM